MKKRLLFTSFVIGAALVAGCKPSAEKTTVTPTSESTSKQLDKAQAAANDAAQDMQDYAFAQKDAFVTAMKAKSAALKANLDSLAATIDKSTDAVKAEAGPKLAALRKQSEKLDAQIDAVQNSNASTWEGVKADAQKTYAAVEKGFADARQWVSDKIAP